MELFQQFLNRVNRGYGQLDKNVFGGLLPGGAATPIGAAFQGVKLPKEVKISPTTRRIGSLIDAAAGAVAGAQPIVERTIKATPDPVQGAIASGLNALPFSVNLFGRYYTGLGDRNLQIPESATRGIKEVLDITASAQDQGIKEYTSRLQNATEMLNAAKAGTLKIPPNAPPGAFTPTARMLNDEVAALKSDLNRIKQGDIPFDAYRTTNTNPLNSPATSFGSVWFSPTTGGYQAKEKYDFVYGAADAKAPIGPVPGANLSPTQSLILNQMLLAKDKPKGANYSPVTDFGRAIVGKMPDKAFEYFINIR